MVTCLHSEVMRRMGFEPPLPVAKKAKTHWETLVDEFPCPSDIQHLVWATRILRNMQQDCGYPRLDWSCDCTKCDEGIDFEQSEMYIYMDYPKNCRLFDGHDFARPWISLFCTADKMNLVRGRRLSHCQETLGAYAVSANRDKHNGCTCCALIPDRGTDYST